MGMKKPIDYNFNNIDRELIKLFLVNWDMDTDFLLVPFIGNGKSIYTLNSKSETSSKVVIKLSSDFYFIKKFPWYCSNLDFVKFSTDFQSFLYEKNFPIPSLKKSKNSKLFQKIDDEYFIISDYINGETWDSSEKSAFSVGNTIGNLHKLSDEFKFINKEAYSKNISTTTKEMIDLVGNKSLKKFLLDKLREFQRDLVQYESYKCVVHGDCNPSNFIFENSEVLSLVDYDNLNYDNPVRDLAEALITFSMVEYKNETSNFKNIISDFNFSLFEKIILGYYSSNISNFENIRNNLIPSIKIILIEIFSLAIVREDISKDCKFDISTINFDKIDKILNKFKINGIHIIDSFEDCSCSNNLLNNSQQEVISNLITKSNLDVVGYSEYLFSPGFTSVWLLKESHLSIHTWPEKNSLTLDIYVCNYQNNNSNKVFKLYDELFNLYKPRITNKRIIRR